LPARDYFGRDEVIGFVYLVMERLDQDLTAWATSTSTKLTSTAIANKGLALLDGLQWLHTKGFLFIDVKPENFMLRGDELVFIDCKYYRHISHIICRIVRIII
jgi:serine/threonine protein kinase